METNGRERNFQNKSNNHNQITCKKYKMVKYLIKKEKDRNIVSVPITFAVIGQEDLNPLWNKTPSDPNFTTHNFSALPP